MQIFNKKILSENYVFAPVLPEKQCKLHVDHCGLREKDSFGGSRRLIICKDDAFLCIFQ